MEFLLRFIKSLFALVAIFGTVFAVFLGFAWLVAYISTTSSMFRLPGIASAPFNAVGLKAKDLQPRLSPKAAKEHLARNQAAQAATGVDDFGLQKLAIYRAFVSEFRSQVVRADLPPLGYGGMLRLREGLDKLTPSFAKCRKFRVPKNENSMQAEFLPRRVKFFAAELHQAEPRLVVTSMGQDQDKSIFAPQETICLRDTIEAARQPEWSALQRPPHGTYQIVLAVVSALYAQEEP